MKMTTMTRLMALAITMTVAAPAAAQRGVAVEVRGGAGIGNHAAAASRIGFDPGPSYGAAVSYGVTPTVGVYAGYSRTGFVCDTGFCADRGMTFTSHGVDAGVRVSLPLAASPWVRAGVASHTLDYSSGMDDVDPSSGEAASGLGVEVGAGLELRAGRTLALTPGIRYVRYGAADDDGVALLVGDVGLRFRF